MSEKQLVTISEDLESCIKEYNARIEGAKASLAKINRVAANDVGIQVYDQGGEELDCGTLEELKVSQISVESSSISLNLHIK